MTHHEEWIVRELKPGDHIRVKHMSFYHHGLYEGDGMVIHFAGPTTEQLVDPAQVTVRRDTLEHFSSGRNIEVRKYTLKEKLTRRAPGKAIQAARDALGEKGYDIIYNNCEHFVNRCVFGKAFSTQIDEMRANVNVD